MECIDQELKDKRYVTGQRIRRERILWGLTQEQLSSMLGISSNYLGQIERGNRDLSRKMEDRLCLLFHLDRNEIHAAPQELSGDLKNQEYYYYPSFDPQEIQRLLDSCSPEELQICGQILRSILIYMRRDRHGLIFSECSSR